MSSYLNRKSNFELLRIVSQLYIILYHIFCFFIYPNTEIAFHKAIQMTFHVGVIDFVLISGYFGIKSSSKGFIKLLSIFLVYSIPYVFYKITTATSLRNAFLEFLVISRSPLWFVKTYIYLYLFSPVLNLHIKHSSVRQKWYVIFVLFFICIYMGMVKGDDSLSSGKNLPNFMLIYLLGNILMQYKVQLAKISQKRWIFIYILLNVVLVTFYCLFSNSLIGKIIWHISFIYCSPILFINAIIFFMVFAQMNIKSKFINWTAKSSFAIYLIHGNRPYAYTLIGLASVYCVNHITNPIILFISIVLLAIAIIVVTVSIDKLLTPLWNLFERLGDHVFTRLKF